MEYVNVLGNGSLERAKSALEELDVVGTTGNIPVLMVLTARKLSLPLERFLYRSAKVVRDRPRFIDHSDRVKSKVRLGCRVRVSGRVKRRSCRGARGVDGARLCCLCGFRAVSCTVSSSSECRSGH